MTSRIRAYLFVVVVLAMPAGSFAQGVDTFDAIAELKIRLLNETALPVDLTGPTKVQRRAPQPGTGIIETELIQLSLTGGGTLTGRGVPPPLADSFFDVFVELSSNPARRSTGRIIPVDKNPLTPTSNSFFDVFFDITITDHLGQRFLGLCNHQPVRVQAVITQIPPIEEAYSGEQEVPLLHCDSGNLAGHLVLVQIVPAQPSHAKIKRELILLEKKLDRLLRAHPAP